MAQQFVLDGDTVKRLLYNKYVDDNSGFIDITTQEVFELYNKNTLLYQRDKTCQNLYRVWGLLKDETVQGLAQMSLLRVMTDEDVNLPQGKKLTLRVATDLVSTLNTGEGPHFKFNLEQWDVADGWNGQISTIDSVTDSRGRIFWKTIINYLEGITITHPSHLYRLFKNAKGLEPYTSLRYLQLKFGEPSGSTYFNFEYAFAYSDIKGVNIFYDSSLSASQKDGISSFKNAFIGIDGGGVVSDNMVQPNDITSAFKDAKLFSLQIYPTNSDKGLTKPTVECSYAFQNFFLYDTSDHTIVSSTSLGLPSFRPHYDTIKLFDNCSIKVVHTNTNNILDMQFVVPTQDSANPDGSKFFGTTIQQIFIQNLNKGNWKIDAPLNNDSVNYLLNNIFDLTKNINNRHLIPSDFNLFKSWRFHQCPNNGTTSFPLYYRTGNNAGTVTIPAFTAEELNEVNLDPYAVWDCEENDLEGYTGEMKIAFSYDYPNGPGANNQNLDFELTAFGDNYLELYVEKIQNVAPNQIITFDFTQRNRNTSTINNYIQDDEIQTFHLAIKASNNQQIDNVDIRIKATAGHEYSTVESATLQFTAVNNDNAFNAAKAVAQARGWTIQFAS